MSCFKNVPKNSNNTTEPPVKQPYITVKQENLNFKPKSYEKSVIAAEYHAVNTTSVSFELKKDPQSSISEKFPIAFSITRTTETSNFDKIIRSMKLAEDCYSFNTLLKRVETNEFGRFGPKMQLEVVKEIKTGDEFQLWFSESILRQLQLAFLVPQNFLGHNYHCIKCGRVFTSPNPLKIHITLNCQKPSNQNFFHFLINSLNTASPEKDSRSYDPLDLTKKLMKQPFKQGVKLNTSESENKVILNKFGPSIFVKQFDNMPLIKKNSFEKIKSEFHLPNSKGGVDHQNVWNSTNNYHHNNNNIISFRPSAFKPYISKITNFRSFQSLPKLPPPFPSLFPAADNLFPTLDNPVESLNNSLNPFNHASQVETVISNMGRSRQGHLCIYCGKVYSRKYGLKIHIRTHTGFKPLKCKYCLRPFGDPSNLNKHVRLHAGSDTPYKCELCGKILVRRRDLERHHKSRHSTVDVKMELS